MSFTVPGLMPSDHPNQKSNRRSRDDGSLKLLIHTADIDGVLPSVRCKIANVGGKVILEDLDNSCVFTEQQKSCRCMYIIIPAGRLPVGLLSFHVALDFVDGHTTYTDYNVEVPASPYHVTSDLD